MTTILVIDDEPAILRTLRAGLTARGYDVLLAQSGREGLNVLTTRQPDAVVLDLGLGDLDGVDLCRTVREWSDVPIIVLSAEDSEHRKVVALDEGADDYVTKPFSMPELLARVRVALRRPRADSRVESPVLVCGELRIDVPAHDATFAGRHLELTPKEFGMLAALARHPGRILTHRALLHEVWGPGYDTETHYLPRVREPAAQEARARGRAHARRRARHRISPGRPRHPGR